MANDALELLRDCVLLKPITGQMPTADLLLAWLWTHGYKVVPLDAADLDDQE